MEFSTKILSKRLQDILYQTGVTVGTAESCTSGKIAEGIAGIPGASQYFKGGIVSYCNEVKENVLHVSHRVLEEQTAVCEEVARQMVQGACAVLNCDFALAATGIAGPGGGTSEIPVGTIWLAYGAPDDIRTFRMTKDMGRERNLLNATNMVLSLFLDYLKEKQIGRD